MRYRGTLICVADMARARRFYEELLGQEPQFDFGVNFAYRSGLALHDRTHFSGLVDGREVRFGGHDGELYFEHDDMAGFAARLAAWGAELVHPLREQPWRQRVVRFYDPDGHVVEVGEDMDALLFRLRDEGLDAAGVAQATGMPIAHVAAVLAGAAEAAE